MRLNRNLPYDLGYLMRCLAGLAGIIAVMYVAGGSAFAVVFFLLFTCVSRNNNELLFYTLLMTIAITMGNGNIVHKGGAFAIEQRVMMLTISAIMIVRIAGSRKSVLLTPFLALLAYIIYMILPSAQGWSPVISFLKLFLFTMVYVAYFGVANSVINGSRTDTRKIRSVFLMMAVFFLIGSMALIPFPGLATMSWEVIEQMKARGETVTSLFTGMTFHSQSLGPMCSMLGVMLFADLLFSIKKPDKLYMALLLCAPILIWKTGSRTAMGSFVAGIAFVSFFFMRARGIRSKWKGKVTTVLMMIVIVMSMIVMVLPSARERASNFILKFNKGEQREITFEEVSASRRGKWESAFENFHKKPMIGNGFQVSEEFAGLQVGLTTLSAPVEKGVWIAAIPEEGGVCGMVIFVIFSLHLFFSLLKCRCYQGLAGFFMLLLINMGEFTIFSMTSIGGMLWAMVFTGVILDAQRMRDERLLNQYTWGRYGT